MAAAEDTPQYEQFRFDHDVAASAVAPLLERLAKAVAGAKSAASRLEDTTHGLVGSLRALRDEVPGAIEKLAVARGSAKTVAYSAPDVAAHGKEIVAAIKQLAAWERRLLGLDTDAERAAEAQLARLDGFVDAEKAFRIALDALRTDLAETDDAIGPMGEALKSIHAKAERCVQERNTNGLALAQGDAADLAVARVQKALARAQARLVKIEALEPHLSGETRLALGRDAGAQKGRCARAAREVDALVALQRAVRAMKAEPVDIAKAMKTLGLAATHKAALQKALAAAPAARAKALGELAGKTGLAGDGRTLLTSLQKAGVI
jgi:hypothetical protein